MKLKELIEEFRMNETVENVLPLAEDSNLRNGILAWRTLKIEIEKPDEECSHEDDQEKWDWMWNKIKFDHVKFADVAGCRDYEMTKLVTRLQALRLIYPDGTANKQAITFMSGLAMSRLKGVSKGSKGSKKNKS